MSRLFALLLTCVLSIAPAAAQTLKIATAAPDGTRWMQEMRRGAEEIAGRSGGRVKFVFYPGGVMGNDATVLRKIRFGQLQGGALTAGSLAEIYPDIQIYSLPFLFRSYKEVDYVRTRLDPLILKELEDSGFISFGLSEGGFAYLMSTFPIRSVEDLHNRKVWIPENDRIGQVGFETAGVSPIPLPLTDVLTGLSTGLIDTVGASPIGAIALQWHRRVKYVTDVPLFYLSGALIVDRKAFRRLQSQDQAVVREVMGQVFTTLNQQTREDNRQARLALERQGIEFLEPAAAEKQRWRVIGAETIERLRGRGVYTNSMLKRLRKYLDDYRRSARR